MCTVLQQHLNRMANGYGTDTYDGPRGRSTTPGSLGPIYHHNRPLSPVRLTPTPVYSYLQDSLTLKRPVDVGDIRKKSDPTKLPHFHIPITNDGKRIPSRSRSTYIQQLYGRRSRSLSRTGMRLLVNELESQAPRPRSPHMNNEEPINLSHYPDGRKPEESEDRKAPIERDDFPAPPFVYGDSKRRRRWSEPDRQRDSESEGTRSPPQGESSDDEDKPFVDEKLDKTEAELKKIPTGMSKVFLTEIAMEREKRKMARHKMLDPRSAARTPAANREPHYRLRFESPVFASPSRIADHPHPWDDDLYTDGIISRRSYTPFLPNAYTPTPAAGAALGRVVSPVQMVKPGYTLTSRSSTLPARFSPYDVEKTYSTDFGSKSDFSDGEGGPYGKSGGGSSGGTHTVSVMTSTHNQPYLRPHSAGEESGKVTPRYARLLTADTPDGQEHHSNGTVITTAAPNSYPLHLLQTTNYRLPPDVDTHNLERHLTDADFEAVFRLSREDFYQIPYWKRCDIKRRFHLF